MAVRYTAWASARIAVSERVRQFVRAGDSCARIQAAAQAPRVVARLARRVEASDVRAGPRHPRLDLTPHVMHAQSLAGLSVLDGVRQTQEGGGLLGSGSRELR